MEDLGHYLFSIREQMNITQQEMADYLGIGVHLLDTMERGVTPMSLQTYIKYCEKLGINTAVQEKELNAKKLSGNYYQKLAARTIGAKTEYDQIRHGVFGLCSEAGEVAGLFQKQYQGHEIDPAHLQKELGDCLWMIAEICTAYGWDLEDVMRLNIDKLRARYPEGFDIDHSLHRKEGDI